MLLFILSFIIFVLFCKAKCAILKCVAPFGGEFLTQPDFTLKKRQNNHTMISGR